MDIINDNGVYTADDSIDVHVFRDNLRLTADDEAFYESTLNDRVFLYDTRSNVQLYALCANDHSGRVQATMKLTETSMLSLVSFQIRAQYVEKMQRSREVC